ncbi:hypothetical protein [Ruania alba]|uniref:Lipoprotein n=1 Tax=Ruania alba TaxID=648782 RepID=A0A1H5DG61_9MICO|nr:hypothetical protein [Ruania alba]SED77846.1 hypothetical protein SAMN04488554_0670 [Ruania alba]
MKETRTLLWRPVSKCLLAVVALSLASLGLVGCTTEASNADPEIKTFPYSGETLILKTNEVATDVVATDREDIQVTRWFEHTAGFERLTWELNGDTLEIDAGCHGIAICDARFEVEVPQDLNVERDW